MPKKLPGIRKFEKKVKKHQIFYYFFKNVFKKIGNKKSLKFKIKKLQKHVIFDANPKKTPFEHFLAL